MAVQYVLRGASPGRALLDFVKKKKQEQQEDKKYGRVHKGIFGRHTLADSTPPRFERVLRSQRRQTHRQFANFLNHCTGNGYTYTKTYAHTRLDGEKGVAALLAKLRIKQVRHDK